MLFRSLVAKHNVTVYSSNYQLYGDMSSRVMSIIYDHVPALEVYSIDEAFINMEGVIDIEGTARTMVRKIIKGTGIPVSLGLASTKTLAKIANKFAKKYPAYNNVCIIDTEEKRIKALKLTKIEDVWGIGRRLSDRLMDMDVRTAYDFTLLTKEWVKKHMTITGVRTWSELQGISCIELEEVPPQKKNISISRTFAYSVTAFEPLAEAVANHAALCAAKLRKQKIAGNAVSVFVETDHFRKDQPQYYKNSMISLPIATNDTREIIHHAIEGLKKIYRKGYYYKKSGVMITEIISASAIQQSLFEDPEERIRKSELMKTIDKLNMRFPLNKVVIGSQGVRRSGWVLKQEHLSPCFTTKLKDIIKINCNETHSDSNCHEYTKI